MTDIRTAFDTAVKGRIMKGERPEDAVEHACKDVGINLTTEMQQNIVNVLKFMRDDTPEQARKRKMLTRAIRMGMAQGLTTKVAVKTAQETTGVKLGEQGETLLIEALEAERERIKDVRVEVISEEEFSKMHDGCIFFSLNNKDGWACCQCSQHNRQNQDACTMCGHGRCDRRDGGRKT